MFILVPKKMLNFWYFYICGVYAKPIVWKCLNTFRQLRFREHNRIARYFSFDRMVDSTIHFFFYVKF